jgi:glycogen synthase
VTTASVIGLLSDPCALRFRRVWGTFVSGPADAGEPSRLRAAPVMRIVLISPEYPPADHMGGIGTNTVSVARTLARRGDDVLVVTQGAPARYRDEDVEVVRLKRRWLPNARAERLLAYRQIAAAARRFRPDVVQAAEWEGEAWWLARWTPVPVVTRLATPSYLLDELNLGEVRPRTRLVDRFERDQTRRSSVVFAPTRSIAERVSLDWDLVPESVEIVPNSLDVEEIARAGAQGSPRELPPRFVAFLGRLERRKGIDTLGDALAAVLNAEPDLHAVLVGRDAGEAGGAVMERFRRATAAVAGRVHVLGELPREDALAVVVRSELVVLPSLWESFGYVCVEAMALGRPVVASDVGGFSEVLEDGVTGWLVPPADAAALEAALTRALADPEARARVSEAARRRARDFDAEAVVDRVRALYERAVEERSPSLSATGRGYRRYFRPDDQADPFHELYDAKRRSVLEQFSASTGQRILDVGGGYGRIAGPLARMHDVVLCDISDEMLEEAARRWPGLELVRADARELPFGKAEFDAVLGLDLMPHVGDLEPVLSEFARVVRPGGRVAFDTTNHSPWWTPAYPSYVNWRPKRLVATMMAGGVLPEWRASVRHHRPDDVRRAIDGTGLRLERRLSFGPFWSAKWHLWWTVAP